MQATDSQIIVYSIHACIYTYIYYIILCSMYLICVVVMGDQHDTNALNRLVC